MPSLLQVDMAGNNPEMSDSGTALSALEDPVDSLVRPLKCGDGDPGG